MIKNNKGVTLVELLIVIVVMGIIAAFAIPAVGTIIDNTQQDAIVADAIAVENAANLFCAQTTCTLTQELTWAQIEPYTKGIDPTYYEFDVSTSVGVDGDGDVVIAVQADGLWTVTLLADSANEYEWPAAIPSQNNRDNVETSS